MFPGFLLMDSKDRETIDIKKRLPQIISVEKGNVVFSLKNHWKKIINFWSAERKKKKERKESGMYRPSPLLQLVIDSQQVHKHEYDGSQKDGKAKRWSHLRIIRVVVPSGKSAGGGGGENKNQEKEEM